MTRSPTRLDDDPIAALERELQRAATRQAAQHAPATPQATRQATQPTRQHAPATPQATQPTRRHAPATPQPTHPSPLRRRLALPATIAAVLIPVLLVAGALALTRTTSSRSPGRTAASRPAALSLVGELAVLRRPARASDHLGQPGPGILDSPEFRASGAPAGIIPALARHVTVTLPGGGRAGVALTVYGTLANATGQWLSISVALPSNPGSPGYQAPESARDIATTGELTALGHGLVVGVVPDRVAGVWVLSPGAGPSRVWPVHDNVVALRLSRHTGATMEWLDRRGRIIRTVPFSGGRSATKSVTAPPLPPLPALLGVLRRPQTAADRTLPQLHGHPPFDPALGTPDRAGARLATTTLWGRRIYVVPFTPPGATGQILDVFGMGGPQTMSGAAAVSAAQIDTGQAILDQRTRRRLRVLTVVPDRVRAITLTLPDAVGGTDRIVGNVATVELVNPSASGRGRITWLDARGRPIASFPWALGSG